MDYMEFNRKREYVRGALAEYSLPQAWLVRMLDARGFHVSAMNLSNILAGRNMSDRAAAILDCAVAVLKKYECVFEHGPKEAGEGD